MTKEELKIQCLQIASTGDSRSTLFRAQEYFEWVNEQEKPKRAPQKKEKA